MKTKINKATRQQFGDELLRKRDELTDAPDSLRVAAIRDYPIELDHPIVRHYYFTPEPTVRQYVSDPDPSLREPSLSETERVTIDDETFYRLRNSYEVLAVYDESNQHVSQESRPELYQENHEQI
jgi:hypothetical protein